jgi:CubicO group peptidase (beta-lactamase class C family)
MPRRSARPAILLVASAVLVGAVFAIERGLDTLGIAVAYKARMLCSGVFVASRPPEDVLRELEIDDLAPLRFIPTEVDPSEGVVRASALGFVRRQAASRGATGCALVPRGMTRSEFRHASVRDTVDLHARKPVQPLPTAPPDDSVRRALDTVLQAAFEEPDSSHLRRTQAVVVMQHGRIVAERYAPGITADTRLLGWSMTKSVMNALVGILVREGRLSLDDPVRLPEWSSPGDPRAAITMRHLLYMSSGLRLNDVMTSLRSDVIRMLLANDDMAAFVAARDLVAPPGSRWAYASGTSVIIARVIRNVLNNDTVYVRFPREALFDRVGMTSALIETDAAGTFVGSSLMYATARDWARFGQLYLNDGTWNGERILPEGWVDFTRLPAPAESNHSYGAHFWLGVPSDPGKPVGALSAGALQAAGHEGQYVTIIPSHDAVIVRLGRTRYGGAWNQATFVRDVVGKLNTSVGTAVKAPGVEKPRN